MFEVKVGWPEALISETLTFGEPFITGGLWTLSRWYRKSHDLEYNSWLIGTRDFDSSQIALA